MFPIYVVNVSATVVTLTSPLLADSGAVAAPSAAVGGPTDQTSPTDHPPCDPSLAAPSSTDMMRSVVVRVEQCVWTEREDAETTAAVGMSEAVTVQLQDCIEVNLVICTVLIVEYRTAQQ